MLVGLRSMKRVRGTALDPFGRTEVRRTERRLVTEYLALVDRLLPGLAGDPQVVRPRSRAWSTWCGATSR